MKYHDGQTIMVGDRVRLGPDDGEVVFLIDADVYSDEFPKAEWKYLEQGIMVKFLGFGLVHIEEYDSSLLLLGRARQAPT